MFTNNESNFAELFINSPNVFMMNISAAYSSQCHCPPIAATYDQNLLQKIIQMPYNKLVKHIIPCDRLNGHLAQHDVDQL